MFPELPIKIKQNCYLRIYIYMFHIYMVLIFLRERV